jgi:hypothetical protein
MKGKQFIYLFAALLLPACVFIFLKIFGKNEFAVEPLFVTSSPEIPAGCDSVNIPYHVPDTVMKSLDFKNDSLVLVVFGSLDKVAEGQLKRVDEEFGGDPIRKINIIVDHAQWRSCVFFLKEPFTLALVDYRGRIRGQYDPDDREDIDRLLTELTIILKKY